MPIDRRALYRLSRCVTATRVACSLALLLPLGAESQAVNVSLRTAALAGRGVAASVGARLDAGSARVGAYAQLGRFMASQGCAASRPPTCNHPSTGGAELSGGVRVAFPGVGRTYPVLAAGVGALLWSDDLPYRSRTGQLFDFEVGVQGKLLSRADYTVALKLERIAQGVSGGMRLESEDVTYGGVVAGVVVPLRRP